MSNNWVWQMVGIAAALLTSTSFLPQLWLAARKPGQAHVSYGTLVAFICGAILWTLYGVAKQDWIIVGANLLILSSLVGITAFQLGAVKNKT
jgi:MtN3 and saliva related transmembrane protein